MRKINGPAAAPIELSDVAGSAILKRRCRLSAGWCCCGSSCAGSAVTDDVSDDVAAVGELIGRTPRGAFEVVVRDEAGAPVVLRNAPLLDDGEPMPTRYWLVGRREVLAVSRLESGGGVRRAEVRDRPRAGRRRTRPLRRRARRRSVPADHIGPRPHGGVGGTRTGIKCLHAHYAWFLAGGDDPVGAWVAQRLDEQAR